MSYTKTSSGSDQKSSQPQDLWSNICRSLYVENREEQRGNVLSDAVHFLPLGLFTRKCHFTWIVGWELLLKGYKWSLRHNKVAGGTKICQCTIVLAGRILVTHNGLSKYLCCFVLFASAQQSWSDRPNVTQPYPFGHKWQKNLKYVSNKPGIRDLTNIKAKHETCFWCCTFQFSEIWLGKQRCSPLMCLELYTIVWILHISGENLALGKPAIQSSRYANFQLAGSAVDGNKNTGTFDSCSHTNYHFLSPHAWWQVDLQGEYLVKKIVITNREDCCREFKIDSCSCTTDECKATVIIL